MGIVPKGFQNIGYYLVEPIIPPACFDLPCKRLLSLSEVSQISIRRRPRIYLRG